MNIIKDRIKFTDKHTNWSVYAELKDSIESSTNINVIGISSYPEADKSYIAEKISRQKAKNSPFERLEPLEDGKKGIITFFGKSGQTLFMLDNIIDIEEEKRRSSYMLLANKQDPIRGFGDYLKQLNLYRWKSRIYIYIQMRLLCAML